MRKILYALLSATLLILLVACSKTQDSAAATDAPAADAASAPMAEMQSDKAVMSPAPEAASGMLARSDAENTVTNEPVTAAQMTSSATSYVDGQRKFVRTANANFRVKDVYQSAIAIENIVSNLDGFVVSNQIGSQDEWTNRYPVGNLKLLELAKYTVRGNLVVRVPSNKTQDFLRALISQVEFLDQRNFDAHDVQFELLRKQLEFLRNQEAQRQLGDLSTSPGKIADRAVVISGQSDAKANRDEAVVVQKEVEEKVAFSTINLSLYQLSKVRKTEIDDVDAIAQAIRPGFFSRLIDAVAVGWYGLLDLLIQLIAVWPLWLAIGIAIFAIKRFRKK